MYDIALTGFLVDLKKTKKYYFVRGGFIPVPLLNNTQNVKLSL